VDLNEGVVDGDNVDVVVLDSISEDDTTNTTETVDANLDGSHDSVEVVRMDRSSYVVEPGSKKSLAKSSKRGR
jgi:hypothetical protein